VELDNRKITLWDTPGLGDSMSRDQEFLNALVSTLQQACAGVHRVLFCFSVFESRWNAFLQASLDIIIQILGNQAPSGLITVCLTRADGETKNAWGENKDRFLKELPPLLEKYKALVGNIGIICTGKDNMSEVISNLAAMSPEVYAQTSFMREARTLQTQLAESEVIKEEAANKVNELQDKLAKQMKELDNAKDVETQLKATQRLLVTERKKGKEVERMIAAHKIEIEAKDRQVEAERKEKQSLSNFLSQQREKEKSSCILF